jgi:hypothetical protein
MVNGKGRDITDADLTKTAASAGVSEAESQALIEQVSTALQQYNIC